MVDNKHYHSVSQHYSTKMMRTSLAVGVVWAVASLCLMILTALVFMQDQWIGDTHLSKGPGNFGLWRWCSDSRDGFDLCRGDLTNFSSLLSPAFKAATVFTGLSVLGTLAPILATMGLCFCRSSEVFKMCGFLQILAGIFLLVAVLSYPAGWDNHSVVGVCGQEADDFLLGTCAIRWTYLLAMIACGDAFLLGFLALTLGCKQIQPEDKSQGYLLDNMELAAEIKTHHPIMIGDRYGDYSPHQNSNQPPYSQSNFQL